jgi:tetratricopeptide (TPR) repeat protein
MLRIAVFFLITLLIIDLRAQSMDTELARIFKIQEQGISYFKNGNPEKAVPLLLESTKRLENKLGKKHLAVAAAYYILGGVYSDLQKDREALIYNEKALAIYEKTGHQYTENLLTSVSSGYQRLGDHKKAIPVLERLAAIKPRSGEVV